MNTKNSRRLAVTLCHGIINTDRNLLACVGRSNSCLLNVPAKRSATWLTAVSYCCAESNASVLRGNSELKVFHTSIRADVATSVQLQLQDSFVTQQPFTPHSRLGGVPCCLHPGISSHEDTFTCHCAPQLSDTATQYGRTASLNVTSFVYIRNVRPSCADFRETRGQPIYYMVGCLSSASNFIHNISDVKEISGLGHISLTLLSKVQLSLKRFSRNSQILNSIVCRFPMPNFTQIGQ